MAFFSERDLCESRTKTIKAAIENSGLQYFLKESPFSLNVSLKKRFYVDFSQEIPNSDASILKSKVSTPSTPIPKSPVESEIPKQNVLTKDTEQAKSVSELQKPTEQAKRVSELQQAFESKKFENDCLKKEIEDSVIIHSDQINSLQNKLITPKPTF